jgi:hypothetical protein
MGQFDPKINTATSETLIHGTTAFGVRITSARFCTRCTMPISTFACDNIHHSMLSRFFDNSENQIV